MKSARAEIVREYGPFPGTDEVNGVTYDGEHVWFAAGTTLKAIDPESGEIRRSLDVAGTRGHRVRWPAPVPDRREPHQQDRPRHRARARVHPRAWQRRRLRARVAEGTLWVGTLSRQEDPPGRSRYRRDSPHHRVEPLRHRRDVGRWRVVAWHVGGRGERCSPHRSADRRSARAARRCRAAPGVSGMESDGGDRFFCGGGKSGKVRAVRRPKSEGR
jgi:hypothetical protein